jgi:hypothetical protein
MDQSPMGTDELKWDGFLRAGSFSSPFWLPGLVPSSHPDEGTLLQTGDCQ